MASYDPSLFLEPPNRAFKCPVCYQVIKNPVSCPAQGHTFCGDCINQHLTRSETCPSCRCALCASSLVPNRALGELIGDLQVKCFSRLEEGESEGDDEDKEDGKARRDSRKNESEASLLSANTVAVSVVEAAVGSVDNVDLGADAGTNANSNADASTSANASESSEASVGTSSTFPVSPDAATIAGENESPSQDAPPVKADHEEENEEEEEEDTKCDWTGPLSIAEEHYRRCRYATIECPYDGCEFRAQRRLVHLHMDTCFYRKSLCAHCGKAFANSIISTHEEYCQDEVVDCVYKSVCCSVRLPRKLMSAHEQDSRIHVPCMMYAITLAREQCARAEQQCVMLHDELRILRLSQERMNERMEMGEVTHFLRFRESDLQRDWTRDWLPSRKFTVHGQEYYICLGPSIDREYVGLHIFLQPVGPAEMVGPLTVRSSFELVSHGDPHPSIRRDAQYVFSSDDRKKGYGRTLFNFVLADHLTTDSYLREGFVTIVARISIVATHTYLLTARI